QPALFGVAADADIQVVLQRAQRRIGQRKGLTAFSRWRLGRIQTPAFGRDWDDPQAGQHDRSATQAMYGGGENHN
ncbi:MAG: hypothetical protein HP490_17445, partial [Nitrospira sp.]|nr:hypothetical protein [Nitrospira sp.]